MSINSTDQKTVLDVGAGPVPIADQFPGWTIVTLDIDPNTSPDICMDARDLGNYTHFGNGWMFDAINCSHALEHFTRDEALAILKSFARLLKPTGTVHLKVPDMGLVNLHLSQGKRLDDIAYLSPAGGITYQDIRDGYGPEIARGNDFYRHKSGYDARSLGQLLLEAGFQQMTIEPGNFELTVVASFQP